MTLKLIKGGSPEDPAETEPGSRTHTARRRTGSRRTVTRRTPPGRDPVAEVLERLDEEPLEAPAGRASWRRRSRPSTSRSPRPSART
ncbi:hypothetical protein GCM10009558_048860 [Virgisporangium aurantiacum]